MFLDKNETPKNANETIFADKIEKDSRTYTIQCVRFKDDSFEISITDTTQSEAQFRLKQQLTQKIAH
jgi:two-component system OmpR family sensor kinase/two-component system phosphate regulon sensor histidine kinase PhoR